TPTIAVSTRLRTFWETMPRMIGTASEAMRLRRTDGITAGLDPSRRRLGREVRGGGKSLSGKPLEHLPHTNQAVVRLQIVLPLPRRRPMSAGLDAHSRARIVEPLLIVVNRLGPCFDLDQELDH